MADSNRVYVSPGVYTSEKDLTYVAQSVGVTTLGLVGETLKGPAFEPILIKDFNEFKAYFGTTSPVKDENGNPRYELPYVAKSYLEESNQLFVTRVLGLTGYKPKKTFGIKTLGGVLVNTTLCTPSTVSEADALNALSTVISVEGTSVKDYILNATNSGGACSDKEWFTIGLVPQSELDLMTGNELVSPLTGRYTADNANGKEWFNQCYTKSGATDTSINGVNSYLFVYDSETSKFIVKAFKYGAALNISHHDKVIVALRSRGTYKNNVLNLEINSNTDVQITSGNVLNNPMGEFEIKAIGATGGSKTVTCSLDNTSSKFVTKVLGTDVFDKPMADFPIYVLEEYSKYLKAAYEQGFIRGLSHELAVNDEGNDFLGEFDTPKSPMVVSEVRGGQVADLFEVITISDGGSANRQIKITIANINLDKGEFDLIVRDFNDTDENIAVLEKFTRCSMNPDMPGYIAKKIGTADGEYELRSKYIMLLMVENHPTDAFPAGFKGFVNNGAFGNATLGNVIYKTEYFDAGDVIGYEADGTPVLSAGDKARKVSLGLSTQIGYDISLFDYKGKSAVTATNGFHLSVNAGTIVNGNYQTTQYDLEGGDKGKLDNINFRKFTFTVSGGFDGWDIYRGAKTTEDAYVFKKATYNANITTNGGVFSAQVGNSDYYAFLKGIETFANPEAVDINIFATPGLNFYDHSSLTNQAIDIIEGERADSLYIIAPPNFKSVDEVVDALDNVGLDSNYSATYWPWVQVRDTENATQLFVPPTADVVRNIALTDNVAYPWFAVAGYSRGLVKAIKAAKKLTLDERDELYKNRINPIATFSDTGTIIWGNKTLQVRESALDRINVRRLLLRARKLISAVAVRLLFEQNDEQVRNEFLRMVNPILEAIKKERGLYEFRVTVSNDPEDLDSNTLRGKIFVKPTRSLEYIDVEFVITPSGASFENI